MYTFLFVIAAGFILILWLIAWLGNLFFFCEMNKDAVSTYSVDEWGLSYVMGFVAPVLTGATVVHFLEYPGIISCCGSLASIVLWLLLVLPSDHQRG